MLAVLIYFNFSRFSSFSFYLSSSLSSASYSWTYGAGDFALGSFPFLDPSLEEESLEIEESDELEEDDE